MKQIIGNKGRYVEYLCDNTAGFFRVMTGQFECDGEMRRVQGNLFQCPRCKKVEVWKGMGDKK